VRGGQQAPAHREEWKALLLGWTVAKHVKSKRRRLRERDPDGRGGGGTDEPRGRRSLRRPESTASLKGTAAASDAFFPFRDGVDEIAKAGATAIIQPGGSVKDEEVIAAPTSTSSRWSSPASPFSS